MSSYGDNCSPISTPLYKLEHNANISVLTPPDGVQNTEHCILWSELRVLTSGDWRRPGEIVSCFPSAPFIWKCGIFTLFMINRDPELCLDTLLIAAVSSPTENRGKQWNKTDESRPSQMESTLYSVPGWLHGVLEQVPDPSNISIENSQINHGK